MLQLTDPAFTPVQQAVVDRLDTAVTAGVFGLVLVLALLGIIAVRALWSR